jgi:DNA-binding NtrC family response regulator
VASEEQGTHTEAVLDPARPLPGAALGTDRFLALYEVSRRLLEPTEPAAILAAIQAAVVQHVAPDSAALLVAAEPAWRAVFALGLDLGGAPGDWPLSWSVIRQVQSEGVAVLASDVRRNTKFGEAESVQRFRIRSVVCVPLGGGTPGVLYLDNRSARPFTAEDLGFVAAVAQYAGLALARAEEHARTSSALARSDERLEALQSELLRHEIVGTAPALLQAFDALRRFARNGARVLLRGETGTGKELFARAYAAHSGRGNYVPVTIPALAPTLVESELFGHVKGAFTEARTDKKGRLEVADGGVLFLDEVGDIEPAVQTKLLRFLDSGELFRVGETKPRKIDALVVSATNRPLEKDVEQGRFRADLLARLGHALHIPPLRERPGDVPLLVEHVLRRHEPLRGRKVFAPETLALLQRHHWPFNVRELQQVVEHAVCLVDHAVVRPEDLPTHVRAQAEAAPGSESGPPGPLKTVVDEVERRHILRALEHTKGNRRRAIELLQISPETFYKRLEDYGIPRKA